MSCFEAKNGEFWGIRVFKDVKNINNFKSHYSTACGPYETSRIVSLYTLTFKLLEVSTSKDIIWKVDTDSGKLEELVYGIIIGRNLLQALNVVIDFEYLVIKWDGVSISTNGTRLSKNKIK